MPKVSVRKSDVDAFYVGTAGDFRVDIDRGENNTPRSIDLVLLGLGACTIGTIGHYLRRKGLPADCIDVELTAEFDEKANAYNDFRVVLHIAEVLAPETRKAIAAAAKSCRIHRTLASGTQVAVELS